MMKKALFLMVLGMGISCFAEDQQQLFVMDRKTNVLYEAKYDADKQMYLPVEVKGKEIPSCDDVKSDTADENAIDPGAPLRIPAIDEGKYVATYASDAIIESDKFEDIFQVYVCHIYKSCDHVNGTMTGFDRDVEEYWAQKPVVFRAKTEIKNGKKNGISEVYYDNGYVAENCRFKDGVENGPIIQYHTNGKFKWKGNYKNGKLNGLDQVFDENGTLRIETHYKDDVHSGEVKKYDENGRLRLRGQLKHKAIYGSEGYDEIYDGVVYDENGKEVEKIKPGSVFRIYYDDLSAKKLRLEE